MRKLLKTAIQAWKIKRAAVILVVPEYNGFHICRTWYECEEWMNQYPFGTKMIQK